VLHSLVGGGGGGEGGALADLEAVGGGEAGGVKMSHDGLNTPVETSAAPPHLGCAMAAYCAVGRGACACSWDMIQSVHPAERLHHSEPASSSTANACSCIIKSLIIESC